MSTTGAAEVAMMTQTIRLRVFKRLRMAKQLTRAEAVQESECYLECLRLNNRCCYVFESRIRD